MRKIIHTHSALGVPWTKDLRQHMEIVEGQREQRFGVEEETDAGEKNENTTTNVGSTEKDTAESVLHGVEEENINPGPLEPRDEKQDGEGDSEEQQLRHAPGGTWLQQAFFFALAKSG
ncbi:hypothetical protein NDU88_007020 [Pleurodeles waltl]|uniref:Uncharacterized protein n=1 Tax=Pleurodeles waltl TaxID=8319 RepID=A0AAV7QJI7_PLEWA|nr:hypothetical protein NDU88_007020 [Pleurodeles waltl]